MSGAFGSGPSAPDPEETAKAQYKFNAKARRDSLTNAFGPAGSSQYVKTPGSKNRYQLETSLSPELQGRFDGLASALGDFDRAGMEQALYDRSLALIRPDLEQGRERMLTKLNTQGIPMGSEAYTRELDRFDRQENDLYNRMGMDAVINAGNESRADRSMNLNELASLLSMVPRAEGNSILQAPDFASMAYRSRAQDQENWNAKKQGIGNLISSGAMIAGAGG